MTNIPSKWKKGLLGQLCSIEIGGTPSRNIPSYWDSELGTENLWVSIKDLNQKVIRQTLEQITELGIKHSNVKLQDTGTVLLSFKLTIGKVSIAGSPLYTNEAIAGLRSDDIERDFLFHGLQQWDLLQEVDQAIKGATLNKEKLHKIEFTYPTDKREQSKIAEVLSTVDLAIEQTESLIAKQQRIKTGLMQDLLTRGIDKHGKLRSEKTHEFKDSLLGRIPVEWEAKELGTALRQARGFLQTGPFGSQLHAYEYVNEGVPVIMPQDILFGEISEGKIARILESKACELFRHRVQPNDIVFSRRGDLTLAAAIGERERGWICGTGCFLLRVPNHEINSKWLADVYRHHYVQLQVDTNAVGSTMASLNNGVMEKLIIAFPNITEQHEIVRSNAAVDAKFRTLIELLDKLLSLKTALMQDLLTGKVRVTPLMENTGGC